MKRFVGFVLSCLFLIASGRAIALPDYALLIPNASVNVCGNCHINPAGGGPRNNFGQDFADNSHTWDPTLAAIDSDIDGYTNGLELQDPDGSWVVGDPDPGEICLVSNPGDSLDTPTPVADLTLNYDGSPVVPGTDINFTADLLVDSCYTSPQTFDAWIDVLLPNGQPFSGNPVFGPMALTLPPGFSVAGYPISLYVPPVAPAGTYTMIGRTGIYPDTIYDESSFTFDITP